jgi:SAM-dependent MidA family methyltransferase
VELVPARVQRIRERLAEAGFEHVLRDSASRAAAPAVMGCLIANEFLDALPVHRLVARDGRLLEIFVGWDDQSDEETGGRFVDVVGEPSTPALAERLAAENVTLADGQRAEICLELDAWAEEMSGAFEAGYAVILDYGRPAGELYGPARPDGTLRAYAGHRVHDDPYAAIGRQDLTAHVDFTAAERATTAHAWRTLGLTTQAEFLVGAGLAELLAARRSEPALSTQDYIALRASVGRLLDPLALGGFRVLVLGRDVPADATLAGLGYRVRG